MGHFFFVICSFHRMVLSVFGQTFTAPTLVPTAFSSYSNGSSTSINSDLSNSCEQAASSANHYTTYTTSFDVGTKWFTNTYTDIVSYGSFTPPEECCVGADWGANCEITASRVGIIYWPPKTDGMTQSSADTEQAVHTVVSDGFTFTSPSIYVAYTSLLASRTCYGGSRQAGSIYKHTTLPYNLGDIQVGCNVAGPWFPLNVTRLYDPPTNGDMYLAQGCPGIYAHDPAQWTSFEAGHDQAASPQFSMPVGLKSLDPAWESCKPFPLGAWDPPRVLQTVSAMGPTTVHAATTTPVASPGGSAGDPLVSSTASQAEATPAINEDPKAAESAGDPRATLNPTKTDIVDPDNPASVLLTLQRPTKTETVDSINPVIDPSNDLKATTTQKPRVHSVAMDPDPSLSQGIHQQAASTNARDPKTTPETALSDPTEHNTEGQASSNQPEPSLKPIILPTMDPMNIIAPHHRSSHHAAASIVPAAHPSSNEPNAASQTHVSGSQNTANPALGGPNSQASAEAASVIRATLGGFHTTPSPVDEHHATESNPTSKAHDAGVGIPFGAHTEAMTSVIDGIQGAMSSIMSPGYDPEKSSGQAAFPMASDGGVAHTTVDGGDVDSRSIDYPAMFSSPVTPTPGNIEPTGSAPFSTPSHYTTIRQSSGRSENQSDSPHLVGHTKATALKATETHASAASSLKPSADPSIVDPKPSSTQDFALGAGSTANMAYASGSSVSPTLSSGLTQTPASSLPPSSGLSQIQLSSQSSSSSKFDNLGGMIMSAFGSHVNGGSATPTKSIFDLSMPASPTEVSPGSKTPSATAFTGRSSRTILDGMMFGCAMGVSLLLMVS